mmetsp:Transcript_21209/g.63834  ORF Transcript_21209/g.63834 Transcript_21209/m.63834 type:complete len:261 (-) Transcript_21209:1028-1810(-)
MPPTPPRGSFSSGVHPGWTEALRAYHSCRWRGADLIISSTRRIISAASVADNSTTFFTLNASKMPSCCMSPTCPRSTSTPERPPSPSTCCARSCDTSSALSSPALSQIVVGMARRARAKAAMARLRFPGVRAPKSSTTRAICISGQPPPYSTRESAVAVLSTHRASCSDLSASSSTCVLAPRSTMVQASALATPEKWMRRSSPMVISSISLHSPSLVCSGWSNVLVMSPPVTRARRSMPSKSACSMAMTPASAKISSGKL